MKPAIRVEGLSKRYRLGQGPRGDNNLTENLRTNTGRLWRRLTGRPADAANGADHFWALKDVSFEVQPGEVVGIIGRNGAGKSTLLKVLSRITEPTQGRVEVRGRMGSLLEVGTGFHPELTGRENVYLNGSILGMTKREIERKFDEIVAFSEIEKFLDTPVKRYSSGMYVRLAFAVAAHLEPEILIIDEVLAVGDAAFQKKCLGKLGDVAEHGRTVLFVSHNMTAISGHCEKVLLVDKGRITFEGPARAGIELYALAAAVNPSVDLTHVANRQGLQEHGRFTAVSLFNAAGQPCDSFAMGDEMTVELEVECVRRLAQAEVGLSVVSAVGSTIHNFVSTWEGLELDLEPGRHRVRMIVPRVLVYPGTYGLIPWLKRRGSPVDDQIDGAISFSVIGADLTGHSPYFERYGRSKSEVYCPSRWAHAPVA
jgi:lipopolysaccharide transport system ATP-binding protein